METTIVDVDEKTFEITVHDSGDCFIEIYEPWLMSDTPNMLTILQVTRAEMIALANALLAAAGEAKE